MVDGVKNMVEIAPTMSTPGQCERDGFEARLTGVDRPINPYDLILPPQSRPWLKKLQRDKTAAWWRGWDKADQQLK